MFLLSRNPSYVLSAWRRLRVLLFSFLALVLGGCDQPTNLIKLSGWAQGAVSDQPTGNSVFA